MTKIRAKNCKVKLQGDFAKKKPKVGRKVKRANVTEISVKSKRIHIPLQNQVTIERTENEKEELSLIVKQLHHYGEHNRLSALQVDFQHFDHHLTCSHFFMTGTERYSHGKCIC